MSALAQQAARRLPAAPRGGSGKLRAASLIALLAVDLVEGTAVVEVRGLRLLPAAEGVVYGHQLQRWELARVLFGDLGIARARRLLRASVLALAEKGEVPASVGDPKLCRIRSVGILLAKDVPWRDGTAPHIRAEGPLDYPMLSLQLAGGGN